MNIYTEWIHLNNEIDGVLQKRKPNIVNNNDYPDIETMKNSEEYKLYCEWHANLMEYWRISKELTLFVNKNFPEMAKEHFKPIYDYFNDPNNHPLDIKYNITS